MLKVLIILLALGIWKTNCAVCKQANISSNTHSPDVTVRLVIDGVEHFC